MTGRATDLSDDFAAVTAVARDYLDGMIYVDEAKLRRAFHPQCLVVGHFNGRLEYDSLDLFIDACRKAGGPTGGTPYYAEIVSIDRVGDMAMVKLTDDYLGQRFTDYLSMLKHEGRWVIVNKTFYAHG